MTLEKPIFISCIPLLTCARQTCCKFPKNKIFAGLHETNEDILGVLKKWNFVRDDFFSFFRKHVADHEQTNIVQKLNKSLKIMELKIFGPLRTISLSPPRRRQSGKTKKKKLELSHLHKKCRLTIKLEVHLPLQYCTSQLQKRKEVNFYL